MSAPYAISREVTVDFDTAEKRVRDALAAEQFGVITEIDLCTTFAEKIDVKVPRYTILGACNPRIAHQAILAEASIGLLLPCNVVIRDLGDGRCALEALDPAVQLELSGNPAIGPLAEEVRARLARAIDRAAGD